MKCEKCSNEFEESKIQESHDVPCYLFKGLSRKEQKAQADKYRRRMLCIKCHEEYENTLRLFLQAQAKLFGGHYFFK